jgi:predicted transcriptional regulator
MYYGDSELSEVHDPSTPDDMDLTRGARIWQRDELLLILKSTGRCLPLEDIAKFVDLLESVLPADRIIRFPGIYQINRQMEQMTKSELVEKKGLCYKITEKGTKLAEEAELSMENDEEADRAWVALRNALANLPSSKLTWDSHLDAALKQVKVDTQSPKQDHQ